MLLKELINKILEDIGLESITYYDCAENNESVPDRKLLNTGESE